MRFVPLVFCLALGACVSTQTRAPGPFVSVEAEREAENWIGSPVPDAADLTGDVVIHRLTEAAFSCSEHYYDRQGLGVTLGNDCTPYYVIQGEGDRNIFATFQDDGHENEDWFGYGETVLAPFDGVVVLAQPVAEENVPGVLGQGRSGNVAFRRGDGTFVVYAHVKEITVEAGERVSAGQPVAQIGNNGVSRNPHIHIGAWRDRTPLQIRFDLFSGRGPVEP